jgi:hypothetical protein
MVAHCASIPGDAVSSLDPAAIYRKTDADY